MKTAFSRRLLAILLVAAMCLSVIPAMVFAAPQTVDFTATDYNGLGKSGGGASVTMVKDPVTVNVTDGYGNSDYLRAYGNAELKISVASGKISEIVITCTTSTYANKFKAGSGVTISGSVVTWSGEAASAVTLTNSTSSQTRITRITVTYTTTTCEHPNATLTATKPATCTEKGVETYHCGDCNTDFTKELDALGHEDNGNKVCSVCGADLSVPTYKKITSMDELVSGQYVLVVGEYAATVVSDKHLQVEKVAPSGDTVVGAKSWTLTVKTDTTNNSKKVSIKDDSGYVWHNTSGTDMATSDTEKEWTVEGSNGIFNFVDGSRRLASRSDNGYKIKYYSDSNKGQTGYNFDFTLYKLVKPASDDKVVLDQVSASLGGQIGLNYYVKLPDSLKDTASVRFTVEGKTPETINVKAPEADGRYKFTCLLNAKEMHDNVKFEVLDGQNNVVTLYDKKGNTTQGFTYTLADYFTALNNSTQDANLKKLAQITLAYGSYAQIALNYKTETAGNPADVSGVTTDTLKGCQYSLTGTAPEGLTNLQMTLSLEAETTIVVKFNATDVSKYTFTLKKAGAEATVPYELKTGTDNVSHRIEIPNIAAKDLDEKYTLTISDGTNSCEFTFCALSYAYDAVVIAGKEGATTEDINAANAARALYLYNAAADAWFNSQNTGV